MEIILFQLKDDGFDPASCHSLEDFLKSINWDKETELDVIYKRSKEIVIAERLVLFSNLSPHLPPERGLTESSPSS